ncbi:MAG: C10 family peptidase, partial [Muribaculaceae bacterium]|nr:C10 family peptidase [Muribaculaceae bacterium]
IFLLIGAILPIAGKERSRSEIFESASRVLIKNGDGVRRSNVKDKTLKVLDENRSFTVVGFESGSYAIVSNNDLLPEILGYSSSPYFNEKENPAFGWWYRSIDDACQLIVATGSAPLRVRPDGTTVALEMPQLLSDAWGQMEPFSNLCPLEYDASGRLVGRTVVGCVALSASQVLRYHQYPSQGEGIHVDTQTTDAHGRVIPLKVNVKDYRFDYSLMKDSYGEGTYTKEEADAVANLCYPVGVSFGMIYGTEASGTFSDSAVWALNKYLKYPEARLLTRFDSNEDTWMKTIFKELNQQHPILYSGTDDFLTVGGGGHAFVFDGYDADGLVHVNWGWYGRNDGYYEVALLNPRIHSFKNQQDMIIGVAPPTNGAHNGETLVLSGNITARQIADAVAKSKEEGYTVLDLSKAELPDSRLPEKAFYSSYFRTIILPDNLKSIGDGAFCESGLTSVVIGSSVTSIGYNAFVYCNDLTRVDINDMEAWCNIDFGNSDSNPLSCAKHLYINGVEVKDLKIPNSVTSIGN